MFRLSSEAHNTNSRCKSTNIQRLLRPNPVYSDPGILLKQNIESVPCIPKNPAPTLRQTTVHRSPSGAYLRPPLSTRLLLSADVPDKPESKSASSSERCTRTHVHSSSRTSAPICKRRTGDSGGRMENRAACEACLSRHREAPFHCRRFFLCLDSSLTRRSHTLRLRWWLLRGLPALLTDRYPEFEMNAFVTGW